jgi:hypothetical protein
MILLRLRGDIRLNPCSSLVPKRAGRAEYVRMALGG